MVGTECRTRRTVGVTIGAVANLVGWIATESVWIVFHALDRLPSTRSGRRVLRLLAGERRGNRVSDSPIRQWRKRPSDEG